MDVGPRSVDFEERHSPGTKSLLGDLRTRTWTATALLNCWIIVVQLKLYEGPGGEY